MKRNGDNNILRSEKNKRRRDESLLGQIASSVLRMRKSRSSRNNEAKTHCRKRPRLVTDRTYFSTEPSNGGTLRRTKTVPKEFEKPRAVGHARRAAPGLAAVQRISLGVHFSRSRGDVLAGRSSSQGIAGSTIISAVADRRRTCRWVGRHIHMRGAHAATERSGLPSP